MPYQTDERLKSYLDTNQLHREQMCRAVLATDQRFTEVRPRHPRGGPDGGRDIEAVYQGEQKAFGAVGFVNQANDSHEQKRGIESKFQTDLESEMAASSDIGAFIFFTNVNLTIGEKSNLVQQAKSRGILFCDVFDRERLRIELDGPNGFFIRYQYLGITLTDAEQASFFSRWGHEIQSVISRGFDRMETALNRILFLQESQYPITILTVHIQLDKEYSAEEIGHFRFFCSLILKELTAGNVGILFGSSDKSSRMTPDATLDIDSQESGIKHGISSGQWEWKIQRSNNVDTTQQETREKYRCSRFTASLGLDETDFLSVKYDNDPLIRIEPGLTLKDLDDSKLIFFCNESLAEKVRAICIYSNGYKIKEISEFAVERSKFDQEAPVEFGVDELADPWVRIRPSGFLSAFHLRFLEETPTRLFSPAQVKNGIET